MGRFKLIIEYDGSKYSGWQIQKNARTVQGEFFSAIKEVFKTDDFEFVGAGRTDAGVHAIMQVAHLDVKTVLAPEIIRLKINDLLPADINIIEVEKAHRNFDARRDAYSRSYLYQISTRRTAFGKKYVWWIKDKLNVNKMQSAAELFIGLKNFESFTDDDPELKSTKVLIDEISVEVNGKLILIRITGSHFIWKLVRRMVGVLVECGRGNLSIDKLKEFLQNRTNEPAKYTAPPSGLFLGYISYKKEDKNNKISPVINIK